MKRYKSERKTIEGPGGKLRLLVLRPVTATGKRSLTAPSEGSAGILWLHGGGYAVGMAAMAYMSRVIGLVEKYGATAVVPEYRLAGRHPYPAALEDCYCALKYMWDNADKLGFDRGKLMVGGESAGGGLTAALCLYARDMGEIKIAAQFPLYPMLDNRQTVSSRNNHGLSWGTLRNRAAWRLYLRNATTRPFPFGAAPSNASPSGVKERQIPAYAVPALSEDCSGLPPAYTFVGKREPFYCETIAYVEALQKAGVRAKADIYPTRIHAFDMLLPLLKISRKAAEAFERNFLTFIQGTI